MTELSEAREALDKLHRYSFGDFSEIERTDIAVLVTTISDALNAATAPVEGDEREALSADLTAHVEGVAYADDIAEGGDPVPDDYERHYCEQDGEDWPCTAVRQASERVPGEPFTLEELAREHERLAEHPNQMSQTVPAFHALTAKALRWAASRRPSTPTEEDVERAAFATFVDHLGVDVNEDHEGEWWDGYRQAQRDHIRKASAALSAVHSEVTQ